MEEHQKETNRLSFWRYLRRLHDWRPVQAGVRGTLFWRREKEQGRSVPLHQGLGLQKVYPVVVPSLSVTDLPYPEPERHETAH